MSNQEKKPRRWPVKGEYWGDEVDPSNLFLAGPLEGDETIRQCIPTEVVDAVSYDTLAAENAALRKQLDTAEENLTTAHMLGVERAKDELARLRAALKQARQDICDAVPRIYAASAVNNIDQALGTSAPTVIEKFAAQIEDKPIRNKDEI